MTQDDLTPWQDTPLVQALTAPGSTSELTGEGVALAAFQSASGGRRGRRGVVRFLGTGMTSVALIGVVGGGVAAAAYTKSLPQSVQSFFHDVLGPIGVPAPAAEGAKEAHDRHHAAAAKPAPKLTPVAAVPSPSGRAVSPSPAASPSPTSAGRPKQQAAGTGTGGGPADGQPAATPTPETTQAPPSPSPSPAATGPAGDPSTWTMSASLSKHAVLVHHGVQVTGQLLDAAGQPVAGHRVAVRVHVAGTTGWQRVAVRRTSSTGTVQAWLGSLAHDELVVLGAGNNVHSTAQRVVVVPVLSVAVEQNSAGTGYVVTVSADGGDSGDLVNLLKHTPSGWTRIGQSHLDGTGQVSFAIPAPQRKHSYVVRLPATKLHGYSQKQFTLLPLS